MPRLLTMTVELSEVDADDLYRRVKYDRRQDVSEADKVMAALGVTEQGRLILAHYEPDQEVVGYEAYSVTAEIVTTDETEI